MYLVINKWVIAVNFSNFSGQYLRNHSTLDIGVLGYIGIVWPKEHPPEVWSVPSVTPCIHRTMSVWNISAFYLDPNKCDVHPAYNLLSCFSVHNQVLSRDVKSCNYHSAVLRSLTYFTVTVLTHFVISKDRGVAKAFGAACISVCVAQSVISAGGGDSHGV